MNVLIIGGGSREHCIAWKLAQSPLKPKIFVAPGNAGTATIATNFDDLPVPKLTANETAWQLYLGRIASRCLEHGIDLVVPSTEDPLVHGITDYLKAKGINCFGPSQQAAYLTEGSKVESHSLLQEWHVRHPVGEVFSSAEWARRFVADPKEVKFPIVIKLDGLAAGKGVVIAQNKRQAFSAIDHFMGGDFGEAGKRILIQKYLVGREVSFMAFSDGSRIEWMIPTADYKRICDGNKGPNTGGVGCYSRPSWANDSILKMRSITETIVEGLAKKGHPFRGVIYVGFMIVDGEPVVLEINCRFGGGETEVTLPGLEYDDLLSIMLKCLVGRLDEISLIHPVKDYVGVTLCSGGYPGKFQIGFPIERLEMAAATPNVQIFHGGTARNKGRELVTAGGRVLTIVGNGPNHATARENAYLAATLIRFPGMHFRRDIAKNV